MKPPKYRRHNPIFHTSSSSPPVLSIWDLDSGISNGRKNNFNVLPILLAWGVHILWIHGVRGSYLGSAMVTILAVGMKSRSQHEAFSGTTGSLVIGPVPGMVWMLLLKKNQTLSSSLHPLLRFRGFPNTFWEILVLFKVVRKPSIVSTWDSAWYRCFRK